MKSKLKAVLVTVAVVAVGLVSGCGGGGGVTGPAAGGASSAPAAAAPAATPEAAALYAANCADCHGALGVSDKKGITVARLQNAIANNIGGMGFLSALTAAEQQTIVNGLTPVAPPPVTSVDGVALYAANCAGCHGALATSGKKGITLVRLQNSITGNVGNMGFLSTLTGTQQQAIVNVLAVTSTPPTTPTTPPPLVTDGATLYAANCAGCHGVLASSGKKGITLARLQNSISGNIGNMGFLSTLTNAQRQAIVNVLAVTTPPPTTPPPLVTDGAILYAANCAGCHSALATSEKAGATAARTQTAIINNIGGMGFLSTLTAPQVAAIATSLAAVTPPPVPAPVCGSCHAIPPATGKHAFHSSRATCATCHGSGYSTTAVNAATHNNGVKNLTTTIGWNATNRSCSNSCHGGKSW